MLFLSYSMLTACNSSSLAPFNAARDRKARTEGSYTVRKGDSLYTIAWRSGHDYQYLAKINNIPTPYTIYPGQKIIFSNKKFSIKNNKQLAKNTNAALPYSQNPKAVIPAAVIKTTIPFIWPVKGKILRGFAEEGHSKGIDIEGKLGMPIRAAAKGSVVYSGNALKGYGNLIILKHGDNFLSAYAHNQLMKVKEGQTVVAGQEIATMGKSSNKEVKLHFEIRYQGKPVDPMKFLIHGK